MAGKHLHVSIHFIWSTVDRLPLINTSWEPRLYSYMGGILANMNARLIAAGGLADHSHLLVSMPSTESIAEIVGTVKANSTSWVKSEIRPATSFGWQKGYAAFSVSKSNEAEVIAYVNNQREKHKSLTFKSELVTLLDKHEITYDEKYLWD